MHMIEFIAFLVVSHPRISGMKLFDHDVKHFDVLGVLICK